VHLRAPSVDPGVRAFIWALVFFLFMWIGAVLLDFPGATSFVLSLLIACGIFLLIRRHGAQA
jgi:hypothetical protein